MIKSFVACLTVLIVLVSSVSAVVLSPAEGSPAGSFALGVMGYQENDIDLGVLGNASALLYGPSFSYSFTDLFSVSGSYLIGGFSGDNLETAPLNAKLSISGYTIGFDYGLIDDQKGAPVAVKLGLYYSASSLDTETVFGKTTSTSNGTDIQAIVSKMFIPFIPYAAIKYGQATENTTNLELVAGTALFFSEHLGMVAEYVAKTSTADGASDNTNQIGIALAYLQ